MLVALFVDAGVAVVVVEGVDVLHSQAHATGIVAGVLPEVGVSVVLAPHGVKARFSGSRPRQ